MPMSIGKTAAPVTELRGVGPKTAASLKQMGINTMADLLRHYPLRFVNYPEITEIGALTDEEVGNPIAVHAEAVRELVRRAGTRVQLCTGTLSHALSSKYAASRTASGAVRETQRCRKAL